MKLDNTQLKTNVIICKEQDRLWGRKFFLRMISEYVCFIDNLRITNVIAEVNS